MKINKKKYTQKWVTDEEGSSFLIRPYAFSRFKKSVNLKRSLVGDIDIDGADLWDRFNYCLIDWKNVKDEEIGEDVDYSDEMKLWVFNYDDTTRNWLLNEMNNFGTLEEEQSKNLEPSDAGKEKNETTAEDAG